MLRFFERCHQHLAKRLDMVSWRLHTLNGQDYGNTVFSPYLQIGGESNGVLLPVTQKPQPSANIERLGVFSRSAPSVPRVVHDKEVRLIRDWGREVPQLLTEGSFQSHGATAAPWPLWEGAIHAACCFIVRTVWILQMCHHLIRSVLLKFYITALMKIRLNNCDFY